MTRKEFIGGGLAFGCMGPVFSATKENAPHGKPLLRLGVVSDIHLVADPSPWHLRKSADDAAFIHALQYFRSREVDGVVIPGDLADSGVIYELEAVAKAWESVFPKSRLPNGKKVERLFVYGNHDLEGQTYGAKEGLEKAFPDVEDRKRELICTNRAAAWERVFHEPFEPIWKKTVKGYLFIGANWINWNEVKGFSEFYEREAATFPKDKPFFYIQHAHLRGTCYGDWAWGHDNGKTTRCFAKHPNLIAISGHSHYSLTDERSVWQGAFTSIGASSLRYSGCPHNEFPGGFENTISENLFDNAAVDGAKLSPAIWNGPNVRQGMVMNVYADRLIIERRDFTGDQSLGPDWVVPLPARQNGDFTFAHRRAKAVAPQFAPGAAIRVERGQLPTRKQGLREGVAIKFPPANASAGRVYHYEVTACDAEGNACHIKRVLSPGWCEAKGGKRYGQSIFCAFARDELPPGEIHFVVRPVGFLGNQGGSIRT